MKKLIISVIIFLSASVSYSQSPLEEPVNIPPYDENNPEMFLISNNGDWTRINDTTIKYFYVLPGDYSEAGLPEDDYSVVLNSSGTPNSKRYISLYNGNDIHPGKLDTSQLAKVGFVLRNANYWVIDRMAYWNREDGFIPVTMENSSHNIINRYFTDNVAGGMVYIFSNSNNNTVQNCRVQKSNINFNLDRAAIALSGDGGTSIKNTKILNNEIYNFVDGFQAVKDYPYENTVNYEGTVLDYNHFFIDSLMYTDCNGNPDVHGNCAYAENAIDLKSGSENPDNPFVITNNMMWGYREADMTDSDLDDVGSAMVCHYNVNNLIVSNNLFYNSTRALTVGGAVNGSAMRNSEFSGNVVYGIKTVSMKIYDSQNITIKNNLNKETGLDFEPGVYSNWLTFIDCTDIFTENNLSVNTYDNNGVRIDNSTVFPTNNGYFNSSPGQMQDPTDIIYSTDPTINYSDLVFTTNRFTNNPLTITIPKVLNDNPSGIISNTGKVDNVLNVYPNPVKDKLHIEFNYRLKNKTAVFLYNILGQLVKKWSVDNFGNKSFTINGNDLGAGFFILRITAGNQTVTRKILIVK